jgi:hypothetical protein
LFGRARLGQAAGDVLVKNAGNERLVRHTLFKRPDLDIAQITGGKADIDPAILDARSARLP